MLMKATFQHDYRKAKPKTNPVFPGMAFPTESEL